tara:strand:- start:1345 stop:2079 length:735 start_codon:yes stop_codon:yes gene_type:complete
MLDFFWNKKKIYDNLDFSILKTDLHSHLIPAIDDGAPDLETSILIIKKLKEFGYKKIITTPHIMSDFYNNTTHDIITELSILNKELKNRNIDIEVAAAAEYYVDFEFEQKIGKEDFMTFGNNHLLIEISFLELPKNFYDIIFKLQLEGYKVVLAHPERYNYFSIDDYIELVNKNIYLQVNFLSILGYYSSIIKQKTKKLIELDLISYIGSDCHNIKHSELLFECQKEPLWHMLSKSKKILNNTL